MKTIRLISAIEASERYGKSEETLYSTACQFKKKHGHSPKWFVKDNGTIKIDVCEFEKYSEIERKAWIYNTDSETGLFWLFTETLAINQITLSKIFAEKSLVFKKPESWNQFFSYGLFRVTEDMVRVEPRYTMNLDFLAIGSRLIYLYIKQGKFKSADE
jgi:hypothetical protein